MSELIFIFADFFFSLMGSRIFIKPVFLIFREMATDGICHKRQPPTLFFQICHLGSITRKKTKIKVTIKHQTRWLAVASHVTNKFYSEPESCYNVSKAIKVGSKLKTNLFWFVDVLQGMLELELSYGPPPISSKQLNRRDAPFSVSCLRRCLHISHPAAMHWEI